jgi:ribosome-associated protein
MHNESDHSQSPPSKTRLKQDARALQKLGEELLDVPEADWLALGLPEKLTQALHEAKRLHARHGARKRQLQYVGKLMREIDAEPVHEYFRHRQLQARQQVQAHHELEHWRDRMLAADADAAIEAFIEQHAGADRQHLRQLVRQARKEREQHKPPKSSRMLFRYLRELTGV